jgi:5-methylcytosine-specific restriction endonuclease McrA
VAHHKRDHKGDLKLFLDEENLMTVCKECHDRDAQKATHRGFVTGHDEDGRPLDPNHPWNRRRL